MKKRGLLCLLVVGMLALSACGTGKESSSDFKDEVVMTIDGSEIMKSEYMVYLYTTTKSFEAVGGAEIWGMDFDGQTADQLVEERTLSTIQSVIAAKKYAAENDIALTDAQKEEVKTTVEQFIAQVSQEDLDKMGIDAKSLQPFMEDSYLYSLVYQALAAECEVDETEKAAYYEENKDKIQSDYTMLEMDSIVLKDLDTATEVAEKAKAGEDFGALFDEYDIDEAAKGTEEGGKLSLYRGQFEGSFGLTELPQVGQVTDPVDMNDAYFVLLMEKITVPTDEEVKTRAEQAFDSLQQAEYSDTRFAEMMDAQTIEKVEEAYNNLENFH